MHEMKKLSNLDNKILIITVAICFVVAHIQNDIIIPSFPDMMEFFGTDPPTFHLMSSANFLAIAVSGLLYGPISDAKGRKKLLLFGLTIFFISTVGCALTTTIEYTIFWRFVQGLGAAAPITIGVALIFDIFTKDKAAQLVGIMDGTLTAAKSLAPIIGAWLNIHFFWQINFVVLASLILIATILATKYIPEQNKEKKLHVRIILQDYMKLLTNSQFMSYNISLALMACCLIVYLTSISLIFINHMDVPKAIFAYYQSSIMASFSIFSFLVSYLIKNFGIEKTKTIGRATAFLGGIFLYIAGFEMQDPIMITISMSLISGGFAILIVIIMTKAITLFPDLKGSAASLIASTRLLLSSVAIAIAGYFFNGSIKPVAIIILTLMTLVIILISTRHHKEETST
jgi:MFS transporter, DHA1 family, multidrug resistance protein